MCKGNLNNTTRIKSEEFEKYVFHTSYRVRHPRMYFKHTISKPQSNLVREGLFIPIIQSMILRLKIT